MKSWAKTYIICALCLIAAGVIYLNLPLSKNESAAKSSEESKVAAENTGAAEGSQPERSPSLVGAGSTTLYRIEEGRIETEAGWLSLAEDTEWFIQGERIETGRGRLLGQLVEISQNTEGKVTQISTQTDSRAPSRIRVVLGGGAEEFIHHEVTITSAEAFWGVWDGEIRAYPPGAEIRAEGLGRRAIFYPAQESGVLTLTSDKGTCSYRGQLEITAENGNAEDVNAKNGNAKNGNAKNGGYSIINEVPVETYLMGVVPSEMPGSYGEEAAKVQAVCARSYAYGQWISSDRYLAWGGHLDDGVSSQVYGGSDAQYSASSKGVEATWGKVLTCGGNLISTNFFSTSCGYTANGGEVWGGGQELPYQQGLPQYTEGDYGDLSEEEAFHAFITDPDVKAFDSHSPWFRWTVSLDWEQVQAGASAYFTTAQTVKEVEGERLVEETVSDIGQLQDIFVYERSQTGMAKSLLLMGSERSVVVEGPQHIRQILGGGEVQLANGENAGVRELLPSAFISIEKIIDTEEKLVSIKICGGGYGHGVGMSQNGVKGMLDAGYTYEEILAHYYPETELVDF